MSLTPRDLGMDLPISRRDFFDGIAVGCVMASGASGRAEAAQETPDPSELFKVRGDTGAALSVPHALRDGRFWEHAGPFVPTGESYDLVVVGGGRGGMGAASEWLRRRPRDRVLVLDNRDEPGGPEPLRRGDRAGAVMCDAESFGADTLVEVSSPGWVERLPVAGAARRDLRLLHGGPPDWFAGQPAEAKQERLAGLTYAQFLREVCGVHPDVERFCRTMSCPEWGYDTRAFGAIDAWGTGYPGLSGLGLDRDKPSRYNSPTVRREWHGPVAPAAVPPPDGRVRLRTSSPVVSVRDGAGAATVGYFDGHQVLTVDAGAVILACWSAVVPHLVPDLPAERLRELRRAVRVPLLRATVRLRDPGAWRRLGVRRVRWTGAYWCESAFAPPDIVRLLATPCRSELGPDAGSAAGRAELLATPYDVLERTVRDQLARLLGPFGFDPGHDITAITVHRWGHALPPEYCRPWHAFYPDGPFPADAVRGRFGRIAIAGSDAEPAARGEAAVRAVEELFR
ncbi:FAD-dependent oxidoreductase [Nonomuraea sp. NPDC049709]|uniref:FAD-dependent oxidoreductase n=1 Tax=Nonomuraea sp. NPDC049709 TaxID=3154736 RepID=UPI00342D1FD9